MYKTKDQYNNYMKFYIGNKYLLLKQKAVQYKGNKCVKCGYDKCLAALVFHHRNPNEKEMDWRYLRKCSWNKIKEELDKCNLLCSNCHAEEHYEPEILNKAIQWSNNKHKCKVSGEERICKQCGKKFILKKSWDRFRKYCSTNCCYRSQERINWPESAELKLMVDREGYVKTGKILGISTRAIKKRLNNGH